MNKRRLKQDIKDFFLMFLIIICGAYLFSAFGWYFIAGLYIEENDTIGTIGLIINSIINLILLIWFIKSRYFKRKK